MVVGNTFFLVVPNVWGYDEGWFVMPGQTAAVPLGSIMPAAPAGYMQMGTEPCINDKCQISLRDSNRSRDRRSRSILSPVARGGGRQLRRQGGHQRPDHRADELRPDRDDWATGDFNGDGKVDINDLTIVLTNYGDVGAAGASRRCRSRRAWFLARRRCHCFAGVRLATV